MDAQQFLTEFGYVASAPGAVGQIRALILNMAVSGKLTIQNKNENSELLIEKIATERVRLMGDGVIKKNKKIHDEEIKQPWSLPPNWQWARFADLCSFSAGRTPSRGEERYWNTGDYPWFSIADLVHGQYVMKSKETISQTARNEVFKKPPVPAGTLLMSFKLSIGKLSILGVDAYHNEAIIAIKPFAEVLKDYFFKCLRGFDLTAGNKAALKGDTLNQDSLSNILVALPPEEEISRIVSMVDELMAFCDKLEVQQQEKLQLRDMTRRSFLTALAESSTPAELRTAWSRLQPSLSLLIGAVTDVSDLRQTILELGFSGLLTIQETRVDSALLDRMKAKKRALASKKIIKRETPTTDFPGIEEMLRSIPAEWIWCRLNDVASVVRGGSPRPAGDPKFYGGSIPFLKVADVTRSRGIFVEGYTSTITAAGLNKTREITERTVLLTNSGATLGVPAICTFRTTFNDGIAAFIELHEEVFDEFLYFYLRSKTKWLQDIASRGQGQPNLNTDIIRSMWFPLPSLTEQRQIVAKIKHLIHICDELAEQLSKAQRISKNFSLASIAAITGIPTVEEEELKTPKTELISTLCLGENPGVKEQAPLATILARQNGEMSAKDLWQRFGGKIDAFYAQLKLEVSKGWILEPAMAEMREVEAG